MPDSAAAPDLKELLLREREKIRALHEGGALGGQIATALTDLTDSIIVEAYRRAMAQAYGVHRPRLLEELPLVAGGGYGRGDTAPYSDVDLLFLRSNRSGHTVQEVINVLVRNLWDYGLKLSQSVRTPQEAVDFARQDLPMRT